ncbi:hypothetical protein ACTG9Q_18070 [Actinokineospora sp. 24-640]
MRDDDLGSLHDRLLARGPLPVAEVVAAGIAVADALASAHRRGVPHGAVTPRNVLALPTSYALSDALTDVSPRTACHVADDVWALGSTLVTLLTGVAPVGGDTAHLGQVRPDAPAAPPDWAIAHLARVRPDVPAALADVLARCLRERRDDRFPDTAALRDALAAADLRRAPVPGPVKSARDRSGHTASPVEPPTVPALAPARSPARSPAALRWRGFAVTGVVAAVVGVGIGVLGTHDAAPVSPPTTSVSPVPPGGDPAVAPVLTTVDRTGISAEVAWTDPTRGQAQFMLYDVTEAGAPPVPVATIAAGLTRHVVTGLDPDTARVCFQLVAIGLDDPATQRGASARVCAGA